MKLLELFKELSLHPKNVDELKGLILQLAVQGKLTAKWREENPDVEPASLLFKNHISITYHSDIVDKEIPFSLDQSWRWARFRDVAKLRHGHQFRKHDYTESGIPVIKIGQCKSDGTLDLSKCNYIDHSRKDEFEDFLIFKGHLLMALTGGTLGKVTRVDKDYGVVVQNYRVGNFFTNEDILSLDFLNIILESELFQGLVRERINQNAQPNIGKDNIENIVMPIPPLDEQKAIVSVVNELLAEVDQLAEQTTARISLKEDFATSALRRLTQENDTLKEWKEIQPFFSTFFTEKGNVQKLRESILQLAVQGKLTAKWREENPDVEPASELLKRIKAEKQRLIKEKKIKKEKALPEIRDEEKPYEVPKEWEWCRFAEIVINRDGERKPITKSDRVNGPYDYYGASGVIDKVEDYIFDKDLLLIGEDGANLINRSTPIAFFARGKYWVNNHAHVLDATEYEILEYLEVYINSISLEEYITGMAQPKMPQKRMNIIKVPLPSINEQKAIVEKVNSLIGLIDQLGQQIDTNQTQIEQLMQSCLKEVFEN
jgi:type I restriction enzyme S subunit